jgi:hypothetical protein
MIKKKPSRRNSSFTPWLNRWIAGRAGLSVLLAIVATLLPLRVGLQSFRRLEMQAAQCDMRFSPEIRLASSLPDKFSTPRQAVRLDRPRRNRRPAHEFPPFLPALA